MSSSSQFGPATGGRRRAGGEKPPRAFFLMLLLLLWLRVLWELAESCVCYLCCSETVKRRSQSAKRGTQFLYFSNQVVSHKRSRSQTSQCHHGRETQIIWGKGQPAPPSIHAQPRRPTAAAAPQLPQHRRSFARPSRQSQPAPGGRPRSGGTRRGSRIQIRVQAGRSDWSGLRKAE